MVNYSVVVWHNPRCRKSREALQWMDDNGIHFSSFLYLKEDLQPSELDDVLKHLGMEPHELLRKGEADYKEYVKGKALTRTQLLDVMVQHPRLIERPIVIRGNKAVVGRDLEKLAEFLA